MVTSILLIYLAAIGLGGVAGAISVHFGFLGPYPPGGPVERTLRGAAFGAGITAALPFLWLF